MTSFPSSFQFEERFVDLEAMVTLLGLPDPDLIDANATWVASKQWMRAGLEFICLLAKESFEEPRLREANQRVAEDVWCSVAPFFESLKVLHEVDQWKRGAEAEIHGILN